MTEYSSKTGKGIKWSVIDQVVRQIVTLLVSAILSRLLTPAEFGLLGMVFVAIGFLQVLKDIGLGSSIIQKQGLTEVEKSTIFWVNAGLGLALSIILFFCSPLLSRFFEEPQLTPLMQVMSLNFLVTSLAIVPDSLIMKAMDFKSYFYRNLGTVLLGGIVGIVMAYYGYGVWALIGQTLTTSMAGLIISFRMVKWFPGFIFDFYILKPHLKFSLPVLADNSINYWVRNIDSILIAKLIGANSLGIYNRAYSLMLMPVRQISNTLSRVMFPSFSLIQDDKEYLWDQYSKLVSCVAIISFPMMIILGVYANEVIYIIYGDQWGAAVPIFQILCGLGAAQAIGSLTGSVYYATGKTALLFKVGLVTRPLMILGIVLGIYVDGLIGMVWGYVWSSVFAFLIESHYVAKILNKGLAEFLKTLVPEFLASLIFIAVLGLVYNSFQFNLDILSLKFLGLNIPAVIVGIILFIWALKKFKSKGFLVIKDRIYAKRR